MPPPRKTWIFCSVESKKQKSKRRPNSSGKAHGELVDNGLPTLPSGRPDARSSLLEVFNPLVLMLREMPQPVVAAVNGVAAGIGASFALACDLVLIARSATLLLAFVNVGLVPDGGSTVLVTARAGFGKNPH